MYKLQIYDDIYGSPGRLISEDQYWTLSAKDKCLFTRVVEVSDDDIEDDRLPGILEMDGELCVDQGFDDFWDEEDYDDYENDFA